MATRVRAEVRGLEFESPQLHLIFDLLGNLSWCGVDW
jgi:hypothetical protein